MSTARQPKHIRIGPYTVGEIPEDLVHQFLTHDDQPIDISGFTVKVVLATAGASTGTVKTGSVVDGANGQAGIDFNAGDLATAGEWWLQFWADNGVIRLSSPIHEFTVSPAAGGTTPTF